MGIRQGVSGKYRRSLGAGAKGPKIRGPGRREAAGGHWLTEIKKPRTLPPEASVLVLRLLTLRRVTEEDGSTSLAYPDRNRSQANFRFFNNRAAGSGNQAASLSLAGSKKVRILESTHCFCCSLITPALCRESAFTAIKAAEAASWIGKIISMSSWRCIV